MEMNLHRPLTAPRVSGLASLPSRMDNTICLLVQSQLLPSSLQIPREKKPTTGLTEPDTSGYFVQTLLVTLSHTSHAVFLEAAQPAATVSN